MTNVFLYGIKTKDMCHKFLLYIIQFLLLREINNRYVIFCIVFITVFFILHTCCIIVSTVGWT